jgi:secreted trypsin-like serine protease
LRIGSESGTSNVRGYALALLLAMLLALAAAVPVFAVEEPAPEDEGTIQPQIVGGERVPGGKYPFVAALLDTTRPGSDYQEQFCGGTLIDEDSVLTAAHCIDEVLRPAKLQVVVGRTALDSDQGQKRGVTSVTPHPRYIPEDVRGGSRDFDAAVLQLDAPVTGIEPVKLPATTQNACEKAGRKLTIAGWGNTRQQSASLDEPDRYPNRMQEAEVPVVSDRRAKRTYREEYSKDLMVAAGREGKDTCQGDSGGPLFERTDRGPYQVGITSFGTGCGTDDLPGVYTEVNSDQIRSFIVTAAGL